MKEEDKPGHVQALLGAQAATLDTLFHSLTRRALFNMGEGDHMRAAETYMKMALRAQSQCRSTPETLMEVKHPRSAWFVKQANIAGGHQQVNNGAEAPMSNATDEPRAREKQKPSNELLDDKSDEWLDFGTPEAAIPDNQELEAVGEIHGTEDIGGEEVLIQEQPKIG